jgi:hypothetical protein
VLSPDEYRTVTHAVEADDTHYIAVLRRSPETDQMTDEEVIKGLEIWKREQHLHAVDGE